MANTTLFVLLLTITWTGYVQSDLLPDPICSSLTMAFKFLGCASGSSNINYCQWMAMALRFQTETGEGLCNNMPCVGYDQTGRSCTNIFPRKCSSSKRFSKGICPITKECCTD